MGKASRDKGARGQSEFARLLADRDWKVDPITCGVQREDMIATDTNGVQWSVEVKNCMIITPAHKEQAMKQAKERKLPWLLGNKIYGTSSWLVQRKGCQPAIWTVKKDLT